MEAKDFKFSPYILERAEKIEARYKTAKVYALNCNTIRIVFQGRALDLYKDKYFLHPKDGRGGKRGYISSRLFEQIEELLEM